MHRWLICSAVLPVDGNWLAEFVAGTKSQEENKHLLPMTCNVKARWACLQLALVMTIVLQREADCTVKGDHVYPRATGHLMVSSGILLGFLYTLFLCFSCIKAL